MNEDRGQPEQRESEEQVQPELPCGRRVPANSPSVGSTGAGQAESSDSNADGTAPARGLPRVFNYSSAHPSQTVLFHVTLLEGSLFLWVGGPQLGLDDFQVATPTKFDPMPCVATLRGEVDGPGGSLAQKLSRRFGMLVFLSFNLENAEPELMLFIQREATRFLSEVLGNETRNRGTAAVGATCSGQDSATSALPEVEGEHADH
mmetsp:Transcript_87593/g.203739  ORF Transcript_87593/g.203739 Transcript_87593/m.203739 type:complete len:204 (+) Transcript_87593:99-710(+)|eukprot:CAMPEP_0171061722 /NCGR_PEP_ID=MMETSP0766_2-20121228/4625_1 /TAXON_ID=439317 /ORGANISM="Gambierdiscus australes, Strain CAWD 149" /LENGTH=203 /DNA_ID=CAMNT_0011517445 /DNA_START=89 /DNA_END=700 /DNA_ORIENTATION=+